MSALQLLQYVTDALFVTIAVVTIRRAVLSRTTSNLNVAALFGIVAVFVVETLVTQALAITNSPLVDGVLIAFIMLIPLFLLRLADDFATVPRRVMQAGAVAALVAVVASLFPQPYPAPVVAYLGLYMVVTSLYSALRFVLQSRRVHGVTRRRLGAVAWGTYLFGADILVATIDELLPAVAPIGAVIAPSLGLAAAAAYYVGFAPPRALRRAWQEPELRAYLARVSELPRLETLADVVNAIEQGAASATGADATVALHDDQRDVLWWTRPTGGRGEIPAHQGVLGRVFRSGRVLFVTDATREDPANAEAYRAARMRVVIGAPITAGEKRLGVLAVYSAHPPVFAQDDMEIVQLLADQAAVILESRVLIDEAARVRAQEQATRLKEDFLSAAAHDLRTPLTTIIGQAQALQRRARHDPTLMGELPAIDRLVREGMRLRDLVAELLDASRLERGALVGALEPTDVGQLVSDAARRRAADERVVRVSAERGLVTLCDARRIEQVVENLVENALKFSPAEAPVEVRARRENGEAQIEVSDLGIGIPAADLPHVFDRFRRGSNVDDRRFAGMGLGLYICRGIVEQHGGRIWAESRVGEGTTFHVALPLAAISQRAEVMN